MNIIIASNTSWNLYNFRLPLIKKLLDHNHNIILISSKDDYTKKLINLGCQHISFKINGQSKSLISKNAKGQIINIGSGKPKQIKKVIEYIKKISKGGNPQFGKIKLRKDEILKLYPNIKKAKNKINWRPKISFNKGLKSTIKFYYEQTI